MAVMLSGYYRFLVMDEIRLCFYSHIRSKGTFLNFSGFFIHFLHIPTLDTSHT